MAERIVILTVKVKLNVEDGLTDIDGIVDALDYSVSYEGDEATVTDTEIEDFEIRK